MQVFPFCWSDVYDEDAPSLAPHQCTSEGPDEYNACLRKCGCHQLSDHGK